MDEEERRRYVTLSRDKAAPRMPEDQLMLSEVAIYTGGRDQDGRPIISFPSRHHSTLESKVKASGLDHILRYFAELASPRDKAHGLAFVADLRFASVEFVSLLKSSLNSLQGDLQAAGGRTVCYAIQPQNKKVLKDTMTILGLRVSKKKKNKALASPIFQTLLVANETDLHNYIDQSQLLTDLGGYLQYSHPAWIKFRKVVEPFFVSYHECSCKYPAALESLACLSNVHLGASQTELQGSLQDMKRRYEEALSGCNLPSTCQKCSDLLHKLKHSEDDPVFDEVAQKPVFRDTFDHAKDCMANLDEMKARMERIWKSAESKVQQALSSVEYSTQLKQLIKWFTKDSKKLLRSREIGDTAGRAETLKTHFDTAELPLAEEKISNAEQLVEKIQAMVVTSPEEGAIDVKNQARRLLKILKEFRKRLDEKEDFVIAVCDYYTLFDEIDRWCNKVLRFLPPNLDKIHDFLSSGHLSRRSVILVEWRESLRKFMRRRPPPDDDDIINLEQSVKLIGDEVIKRRSFELIDRFDLLMSVLSSKRPALRSDVQQAMKWRHQFLEENDFPDSDRLSHSGSYVENRSAPGREDQSEIVDPLMQRLVSPDVNSSYYQGQGNEMEFNGGSLYDGSEVDGGKNSEGSIHRSIHDDKGSVSSRSQSSTVGRISSKDYYSGNIPPSERHHVPNGSQRPHHQHPRGQVSYGGHHPQKSLLRQHFMLSASQPHLPTSMEPYVHPYVEVDRGYSPYIMNDHFHQPTNVGGAYYQSLNRIRNHSESYIPMLSDIEGGNSSGAEVKGPGDSTCYVTAYDTLGGDSQFFSSAVQSSPNTGSQSSPLNEQQALHMQNHMNGNNSSNYITSHSVGSDLSPGQIPSFAGRADHFQTSTPRCINSNLPTYPQRINPSLPVNQYSTPSPTGQMAGYGSQRQRSPYDDIINGIDHMKVKSLRPAAVTAKSTPDLRRLSSMEMNFDLDPELVASELDSDEQVEYYKRVCGFLKNLPTKKRKPRRLRYRQGKSKVTAEEEHPDAEGKHLGNVDKGSEYSRSTGSLFDNSVNEDISFESQGYVESPRVKAPVESRPTSQAHDRTQTLTRENLLANSGKEDKSFSPVMERPPTGLSRTLSPSKRRNLIPDGTPPIAPLTDSLRRFLEDTEQERDSPEQGGQGRDEEVILEVDDEDDEDLRMYEELLSHREEELERMPLPGDTDDEQDDDDLIEHEEFLNQLSSIEKQQRRNREEADQIASENNIKIGQADELLRRLSQEDRLLTERPPSPHLSDEGAVLDGMSIEDVGEHGSSIATERESVESGLGMQFKRDRSFVTRYQAKV